MFLDLLKELGIRLVCIRRESLLQPASPASALFPPSDGYEPPEDPLVGVARLLRVTAELKKLYPELAIVGSGYSYLQEWLPRVAQHEVRTGAVDFVGLGRLVLAYPELPLDVIQGRELRISDSAGPSVIVRRGLEMDWYQAASRWIFTVITRRRRNYARRMRLRKVRPCRRLGSAAPGV
jgi:hypothetical protein